MKKIINHLRSYRKNSTLTQYDVAMLLQLKGNSIISRCEKGFRNPSLEMIAIYHLLFDTPMQDLIANHIEVGKELLILRIPILIKEIEDSDSVKDIQGRVIFLKAILARLSSTVHEK